MISSDTLLETVSKLDREFTREEVKKIFDTLNGHTSTIFLEFLSQGTDVIITPESLIIELGISYQSVYRALLKLQEVRLIERVGKKPNEGKGGGPPIGLYRLSKIFEEDA